MSVLCRSKLLLALDAAVAADPAAVAGAVMNKEYMAQLVEVQHQRGAQGGHQFAAILDTDTEKKAPEGQCRRWITRHPAITTDEECFVFVD